MANLLAAEGQLALAEDHMRQALEGSLRVWGQDHQRSIAITNSLGALCFRRRDYAEAKRLFESAHAGFERLNRPRHADTLVAQGNLAAALEGLVRTAREAGDQLQLAQALEQQGAQQLARGLHQQAQLSLSEDSHLPAMDSADHALFAWQLRARLGTALVAQAQWVEAESLLVASLEVLLQHAKQAELHGVRRQALQHMIEFYAAWHTKQPDNGYDERAQGLQTKLDGLGAD